MKIVFSHIEKTAGTSFRVYLYGMFPKHSFFWFSNTNQSFPEEEYFLYGGHRIAQEFDDKIRKSILISIIREPVERIKSLHRYIFDQIKSRSADVESDPYCLSGFSPYSIRDSILNCEDFRNRCSNVQALNFCRIGADPCGCDLAEEAVDYINSRPSIIGMQENMDRFILHLVRYWGFSTIFPRENVSTETNGSSNNLDNKEKNFILELCEQDSILYTKLKKNAGSYNILNKDVRQVSIPSFFKKELIQDFSIEKIDDKLIVGKSEDICDVVFRVQNSNGNVFKDFNGFNINFSYHITNKKGDIVVFDGLRTNFLSKLNSYEDYLYTLKNYLYIVKVLMPKEPGEYFVEPAMVIEDCSWIDSTRGAETKKFLINVTS